MNEEDQLFELLLEWEEDAERGILRTAEEMCVNFPHLVEELARRIEDLQQVAWINRENRVEETSIPPFETLFQSLPIILNERYRLDELLGRGGFGQVFRAFDLQLQRNVALKLRRRRPLLDTASETHLLQEARRLARLNHPGIVSVYDVGRHDEDYFIVSQFIDGCNLAERLQRNPPTLREAIRIVVEAARSLHNAHDKRVIHLDIKPGNILLDQQDRVYVADFGIAINFNETVQRAGTLAYMAPEQLYHDDTSRIDHRADVYGLGLVLYELLTRRHPFCTEDLVTLERQIREVEPPLPRTIDRRIPKEVERICLRCLAKSPTNRYRTALALADDLFGWLNQRRTNWALVLVVLECILVVAWFGIVRPLVIPDERTVNKQQAVNSPLAQDSSTVMESERSGNMQLAVNPPPSQLEDEISLFNGRDLGAWEFTSREYDKGGINKKARMEDAVLIKDGVLICGEEPMYWLSTHEEYADFVLKVEYRFPSKTKVSMGGAIPVRMTLPGPYLDDKVRVRIGGWATAKIQRPFESLVQTEIGMGRLANVEAAERPNWEWNELTVSCVGCALAVRVNDVLVNQDYIEMPKKGRIGLGVAGNALEFRNIRLVPIKK